MKSTYKIGASVFGGFVLGACAVSLLYAQGKPPGYIIAEIDVTDQGGYSEQYLPKARANIKEFGGKFLAAGKAIGSSGAPPAGRVVLLQFPDMEAVKAFQAKQRQLLADVGEKYAKFRSMGIEGVEQK